MAISPETRRPRDYREYALEQYIQSETELMGTDSYTESLEDLAVFFSNEALPITDDKGLTNLILKKRDAEPVINKAFIKPIIEVPDIADDLDIEKGNNFMPNLILNGKIQNSVLPVVPKDLELWYLGKLNFKRTSNHSSKPAFRRMYALFPVFTTDLIVKINSLPKNEWHLVEAHSYVAYNIMAQLVDQEDEGVMQYGVTNQNYLTT